MNIIYVARHDRADQSNDEEGSISYALEKLGHSVMRINEKQVDNELPSGDLLLFHHWENYRAIESFRGLRCFWCFDPIECKTEPNLNPRWEIRRKWIERLTHICSLGFLTDGDYVHSDTSGKLHWLCQAADPRLDFTSEQKYAKSQTILFSGIATHGYTRETFVKFMTKKYRNRFLNITEGFHKDKLDKLLHNVGMSVAPDGPLGDYYWSNRVYLVSGYGGFLLHPYRESLTDHYKDKKEIVYYRNRDELVELIQYYTEHQEEGIQIAQNARKITSERHTYLNRCQEIMSIIRKQS